MKLGITIEKIFNRSMVPQLKAANFLIALQPGSFLLSYFFKLKPNDMVLVKHQELGTMVKTVGRIDGLQGLWLQGESRQSIACQQSARVDADQIIGKVIFIV